MAEQRNINLSIGDPEPSDVETRIVYVQRVAAFFQDIMNNKLELMKSQQAIAMQDPSEDMMMVQYRRGAINAFALLQDWGDSMVAEAVSISLGDNPPDGIDNYLNV